MLTGVGFWENLNHKLLNDTNIIHYENFMILGKFRFGGQTSVVGKEDWFKNWDLADRIGIHQF